MASKHGPSVKDDATYEALRDEGASKAKAARIANAKADPSTRNPSRAGGRAKAYEEWTLSQLYDRAKQLDIAGRSKMDKDELIAALRSR